MSQSESRRVAHCMYVEIELKKKKKKKNFFDSESLVLRKFRKITAISHPWSFRNTSTAQELAFFKKGNWSNKNCVNKAARVKSEGN